MLNILIYQVIAEINEGKAELDKLMTDISARFDDVQEEGLQAFLMQQEASLYEPLVRLYLKERQLEELKASCTDHYLQKILKGESVYRMPQPAKSEAWQ